MEVVANSEAIEAWNGVLFDSVSGFAPASRRIRTELEPLQHEDGSVWAGASTWLVPALNPA